MVEMNPIYLGPVSIWGYYRQGRKLVGIRLGTYTTIAEVKWDQVPPHRDVDGVPRPYVLYVAEYPDRREGMPPDIVPRELVSPGEAAKRLDVDVVYLLRLADEGKISKVGAMFYLPEVEVVVSHDRPKDQGMESTGKRRRGRKPRRAD